MSEVNKLAHELAFTAAREFIGIMTVTVEDIGEKWHDINGAFDGEPLGIFLKPELRYLKLRKLLVWHPTIPNLVRIQQVN